MRGKLITLEGVEGVGKSTILPVVKDFLVKHGVRVVHTREPGGTELGEQLRDVLLNTDRDIVPKAELLLMFAARAQHTEEVIIPALASGNWVVCDRYVDASFAYQGGGRGLGAERVRVLEQLVLEDFKADLTLLLDASRETSIERTKKRRELDRIESEGDEFFERVRLAYLQRAELESDRIKVIDANPDFDTVAESVRLQLAESCSEWLPASVTS